MSEVTDRANLERASPVATGIDLDDMDQVQAASVLLGTVLYWHHQLYGWCGREGVMDHGSCPSAAETLSRCFQRRSSGGKGWHGTIPLPEWLGPLTPVKIAVLRVEAGDDGGRVARDLVRQTGRPIRYCKNHFFPFADRFPPAHRWTKMIVLPDGGTKSDVLYNRKDGKRSGPWISSGDVL